jgi:hypothetical protein
MIQRAVNARDHFHGERTEIEVFSTPYCNQLLVRHIVGMQDVLCTLRSDDGGVRLQRDVRDIEHVIIVCVRDEDKISPLDMSVNDRCIRYRNIAPSVGWAYVAGQRGARRTGAFRCSPINSR